MKHFVEHIFFDLDHTLWDFEKNSTEAIHELFFEYGLHSEIPSFEIFINDYQNINHRYWDKYNKGEIDKHTVRYGRFVELFERHSKDKSETFAIEFADKYIAIAPKKTHLFEGTHEVLSALNKRYKLHLVSNGFKEVLATKIDLTDLRKYFDIILSAEDVGVNKPHPLVFETAMQSANSTKENSVMIGDSLEADIKGALNVGMKAIHFNPKNETSLSQVTEIKKLTELIPLFL